MEVFNIGFLLFFPLPGHRNAFDRNSADLFVKDGKGKRVYTVIKASNVIMEPIDPDFSENPRKRTWISRGLFRPDYPCPHREIFSWQ